MKSITTALKNHIASELTTTCLIWKITRKDGQVFGFTDHDEDIVINGLTYQAATGFTPTNIETNSQLSVDNLEIEGVISSETITDADLVAGLWDYALIEVKLVNYADLNSGALWMRRGRLGEVKTGRVTYYAELRGMFQNLQQTVGRIFTSSCNADFCDSRCKLNAADYTSTGTITAVTNTRVFADTNLTNPSGYFKGGWIRFDTGSNAGIKMEVKEFSGGVFTLQEAMPYDVFPGDTYTALAGCDKTFAKCKFYGNYKNFRGYPNLPGRDKIIGGK